MKLFAFLLYVTAVCASAARLGRNASASSRRAAVTIDSFGDHELEARPKLKSKLKSKMKSKGRARGPTNTAGRSHDEEREKNVTRIGECDEPFPAPDQALVQCPGECPLMRFHPDMLCHWRCISADACSSHSGVVDEEAGYCYVCAVPGCDRCRPDRQECKACMKGFGLVDGKCHSQSAFAWMMVLVVLGVLVVLVLAYVVYLAWRPVVSQGALDWGLDFRSKAKNRADDGNHALYGLDMSLADTVTSAGGIGVNLHFSWQRLTLWWSAAVTLGAMLVTWYHERLFISDAAKMAPEHDDAEGVCTERLMLSPEAREAMRVDLLIFTGAVYVVTSAGCVAFAWWQRQKFQDHDSRTSEMTDYALTCGGFPVETDPSLDDPARPRLEQEYLQFLRSAWGDVVVGVSIPWNLDGEDEQVRGVVSRLCAALESERLQRDSDPEYSQEAGNIPSSRSDGRPPGGRASCCCQPFLEALNGLWWGELPPSLSDQGHADNIPSGDREIMQLLRSLPVTGFCFAVFETERAAQQALSRPLPKFRGEHEVGVEKVQGDAETVLWDGFSVSDRQRKLNCVKGVVHILLLILIWTVCFWGPYTYYILSWQNTGGASQGDAIHGTVIGLLITVGNQIVYAACGVIAERCRYRCRDERDAYYTGLYTFAVAVNTLLDMWLITEMAVGWQRDAAVDPHALVRNPSLQHSVFSQLIFYLWPCTLLVPFMLEPIVLNVAPYFLAKWLVRARPNCSKLEAEECLTPPPFDLSRYGDNLINIMMVCLFFLLTAVALWWIFFMLTVSLLFIYMWDCYRFKRGTARTHIATPNIDVWAQYVTAVPCALLASGFAFKLMGGQSLVASWGPDDFFQQPEVWSKVCLAFVLHLAVHLFVLAVLVPAWVVEADRSDHPDLDPGDGYSGPMDLVPYENTAMHICCNWFNANPVHCIRSHYVYQHRPAHVFFQPGREYLHKRNERPEDRDALIIYECENFAAETSVYEDLKAGANSGLAHLRRGRSARPSAATPSASGSA